MILRTAGLRVETYFEAFPGPILPDSEWLAEVSRRGWIALSHDRDIRYDPLAQAAIMENGGRFFLLRGHSRNEELARMFLRALPRVRRMIEKKDPPFMAAVRRIVTHADPLRVEVAMLLTLDQWRTGTAKNAKGGPGNPPL